MAADDKLDYVIFCKGASEEVKNTILHNLKRGTISVMPICLKINEENVNILNDIAACLDSDIVSYLKGDTISSSVSRDLGYGKSIEIVKNSFTIECLNKNRINRQIEYLEEKINKLQIGDPNIIYLNKRLKNLQSDKVTIKISRTSNTQIKKDIDDFLKFIKNIKSGIINLDKPITKSNKRKIYTFNEFIIIIKKFKSIVQTFEKLGFAISMDIK